MSHVSLAPPEVWRHLLRATLRECSYLPDPIAREYMHKYALDRYRRNSLRFRSDNADLSQPQSQRTREKVKAASYLRRQKTLRRSAKQFLATLKRANQGHQQRLEKVLMLAYGRIGPKKYSLFSALLRDAQGGKVLNSSADVQEALKQASVVRFGEEWKPPQVLMALLRSQKQNTFAQTALVARFKLPDTFKIPELNSWRKPMPQVRRKNIRKKFFNRARFGALPPLDPAELDILRGLIYGTEPWKPPARRKNVSRSIVSTPLESFLLDGPQKGSSFNPFSSGRPHRLTRRYMRSLWRRIYNLIPQQEVSTTGTTKFAFPSDWQPQPLVTPVKNQSSLGMFDLLEAAKLLGRNP